MSSHATKPSWLMRLSLAAITLLLSGCQNYFERSDKIAFHAGEAPAYNKAVHIIDPWPAAAARTDLDFDGNRMVRAIERYETGQGATSTAPSAATGVPRAASPAGQP